LRSSQLNNDETILYVEKFQENWCRVYYQDQHYEIYCLTVHKFLKQLNANQNFSRLCKNQYHSPIKIGDTLFSPTMNIKDRDCEYFNLLKVEEKDPFYESLLERKQILKKAKMRYLEHKKRELFDLY